MDTNEETLTEGPLDKPALKNKGPDGSIDGSDQVRWTFYREVGNGDTDGPDGVGGRRDKHEHISGGFDRRTKRERQMGRREGSSVSPTQNSFWTGTDGRQESDLSWGRSGCPSGGLAKRCRDGVRCDQWKGKKFV